MTALFHSFRLPSLAFLTIFLLNFSTLVAQDNQESIVQTEDISANNSPKTRKGALEAEKNAHNLQKTSLLLAIAQDRDRQAAEAAEDIRSRRLRIEEDLTDADENPKNLTKKQRLDLESQFKSLQKKEKIAIKARETSNSFLLEVTQAAAAEPSKRAKFIGTYEKKHGPVNDSKPVETLPTNAYATNENAKSQSVSMVENAKKTVENAENDNGSTPSVLNQNATENPPVIAVVASKNKKTRKPKNNESHKKEAEKISPKASKKKGKKAVETLEIPLKTDNLAIVPTENTSQADNATAVVTPSETPSVSESIVANTTENTLENKSENLGENTNVTADKKSKKGDKKSDKKSKKTPSKSPQGSLVSYRTYDRSVDVYMNTPAPECAIAFDGKDDFTGKMKRETSPARFFTHTDDVMRKALGDKDFITCDITGTKVESSRYTYLNLNFTILSKDIQRSLGFLDKGTPIIFVLVNGTKVTLRTTKTDIGVVDIDKGTTTYRAQLVAESITDMTGSELDYVRVNWSSGYEDYEVFDVDILKNLFNCLYKK